MRSVSHPSSISARSRSSSISMPSLQPIARRRPAGHAEVDDVGREARAALAVDRLVPLVLGERLRLACDQIAQRAAAVRQADRAAQGCFRRDRKRIRWGLPCSGHAGPRRRRSVRCSRPRSATGEARPRRIDVPAHEVQLGLRQDAGVAHVQQVQVGIRPDATTVAPVRCSASAGRARFERAWRSATGSGQ